MITEEEAERIRQERRNPCIESRRGVDHPAHWWVDDPQTRTLKPFEYWCPGSTAMKVCAEVSDA